MASTLRVLVVDDERNIRSTLRVCLEGLGCRVTEAPSVAAALAARRGAARSTSRSSISASASESGLELIPKLLAELPTLDVIVITAFATIDTAVEAIRRGARDYLPKPFTPAQIDHLVHKTADRRALSERVGALERTLAEAVPEVDLETRAPLMRQALELVSRAAASDAPVLLRGESGTGKGVLARTLHAASPRRSRPFVIVNCPTLSERAAHERAVRPRQGRVHRRGPRSGRARSRPPRAARSSSTRSPSSRRRCRRSCSASSRRSSSSGSARPAPAAPTSGSSRPRTATSRTT